MHNPRARRHAAHYAGGPGAYPQDACCVERNIAWHLTYSYVNDRQILKCPGGDDGEFIRPATPYGPSVAIHYKFKHAWCARGSGIKLTAMTYPSSLAMIREYRSNHGDKQCGCRNPENPGRRYNCGFGDGHVASMTAGNSQMMTRGNPWWDPHWSVDVNSGGWTSDPSNSKDF